MLVVKLDCPSLPLSSPFNFEKLVILIKFQTTDVTTLNLNCRFHDSCYSVMLVVKLDCLILPFSLSCGPQFW